ncbi:hypothetical protein E3N88_05880 [Mikania micrantha]|uniref:Uncharacterized protein n=1 Tax=Mikania micrantha TaxID=192012 RepID=A0A5N6PM63_9ASTR|nr:hypothetical protein E3N88_05880 [Mikania micrantha]
MAMEAYTSKYPDKIHNDVLYDARQACYKVNRSSSCILLYDPTLIIDSPNQARDAFYSCLEKESNNKPTEIGVVGLLYPVECKKTRETYDKICRRTWVKHFDRQYCAKKRVQRLLDDSESRRGPMSLPQASTFKSPN